MNADLKLMQSYTTVLRKSSHHEGYHFPPFSFADAIFKVEAVCVAVEMYHIILTGGFIILSNPFISMKVG